jgi:hypothetical protein
MSAGGPATLHVATVVASGYPNDCARGLRQARDVERIFCRSDRVSGAIRLAYAKHIDTAAHARAKGASRRRLSGY